MPDDTDLWLGVCLVINLGTVIPVLWLLGFWVLDLLRRQNIPVLLQGAGLHLLVVDLHLVGLIRVQDQCVEVSQLVVLAKRKEDSVYNTNNGLTN